MALPIAVGSVAFHLGPNAAQEKSHEWTIFVRLANPDADPAHFISKVVFTLHPSFTQPTRVVTEPPFQVTERGWGEFEIHMQVHLHDHDKHIDVAHLLKLYAEGEQVGQPNPDAEAAQHPVVSERYDEIVFKDPSEQLRTRLSNVSSEPSPNSWRQSSLAKWFSEFDTHKQKVHLDSVFKSLVGELQNLSKRRLELESDLSRLKSGVKQGLAPV